MQYFKSDDFYNFVNQNQNIFFEFYLKRGGHPFIRTEYANGYKRDISLRNYSEPQIQDEFMKVTQQGKLYRIIYIYIYSW
jgi:hypothetical protein